MVIIRNFSLGAFTLVLTLAWRRPCCFHDMVLEVVLFLRDCLHLRAWRKGLCQGQSAGFGPKVGLELLVTW